MLCFEKYSEIVPKVESCAGWWILNYREAPQWEILGNRANYSVAAEKMKPF